MDSIRHYYHLYSDGQWQDPVREHCDAMVSSGLRAVSSLTVCIVGHPDTRRAPREFLYDLNPVFVEYDCGWEQHTLNRLRFELHSHNDHVLYTHTKGASDPSPINIGWRRAMTQQVVNQWRDCVWQLSEVDAVGCHWLTPEQYPGMVTTPFFGGNFWWANADYLRRLPAPLENDRWDAERWIGLADPRVVDLIPGWPAYHDDRPTLNT